VADKVRYGFLGASQIIRNSHAKAFAEAANAEVLGVASRRPDKARQYADDLGLPRVYTYEDMLADPDVDAVLCTLPMSLHCEWTVRAAEAGKHVLCEKPLVLTVEEAERIKAAADANGVLVLEAFTHVYPPQMAYVRGLLDEGRIGEIRVIRSEVLYPTRDWDNDTRANPALGGRVLIEAGCYCMHTIRHFMGAEPVEYKGFAVHRNDGQLQTTFAGVMRFAGNRLGYLCTTMESPFRACAEIIGAEGRIEMPDLFNGSRIVVLRQGEKPAEITFDVDNRFRMQVEHFSDCILRGDQPIVSLDDSIANIRALTALNDSAYA